VPDLPRQILRVIFYGIGLGSATGIIMLIGPYISFGGWAPLDGYIGRSIAILVLYSLPGSFAGFKWFVYKKKAKALTEGISDTAEKPKDSDGAALKDALATVKQASSDLKFPLSRGATPADQARSVRLPERG
jgi:hypothetical protein